LKNIHGESFEIRLEEENSTVLFKGALRLSGTEDYAPILDMLKETLIGPPGLIVLDLRELDFLNSSGITMLSLGLSLKLVTTQGSTFRCSLLSRCRGTLAR
jgi:hypothetical protein